MKYLSKQSPMQLFIGLLFLGLPYSLGAQLRADKLVDSLGREHANPRGDRSAYNAIAAAVQRPGVRYRPRVDSILARLERTALTASDDALRGSAVALIALAGRESVQGRPTALRLQRIYDATADVALRLTILRLFPTIVDSLSVLAFLERVAIGGERRKEEIAWGSGENSYSKNAIEALLGMGQPGKTRLRRLAAPNRINDPVGRAYLQTLTTSGALR